MNEYLLEAREELKRLEHILYVSLKYTRTVDVLINALHRLVSVFDLIFMALLEHAQQEKRLEGLPKSPALRGTTLGALYPEDKQLQKYLSFYLFLRTVLKLPHKKRQEYRRHVTLVVDFDNSTAEIDSDNLLNCERFVHRFLRYAHQQIEGEPKEA